MDKVCVRCATRTLGNRSVTGVRAHAGSRSFSLSSTRYDQESDDSGVAKSGRSFEASLKQSKPPSDKPAKTLIRRTSQPESADRRPHTPLIRRTDPGKDGQDRGQSRGPLLRRPSSPQTGPILRRAGPPGTGQSINRGGGTGGRGGFAGSRPGGALLIRREGQGQGQRQNLGGGRGRGGSQRGRGAGRGGRGGSDRRLRKAPEEEEEFDEQTFEQEFRDYVDKYVDRPANPTEPLPYNPAKLTLDDLKSDWPNTLLSTSGMTESVIQKVQWLARRLPHGYQSPEQIAEHYLKGNLTRFESEEERKTVLKLAAEFSAKTKTEKEDGTLHKHETPRFAIDGIVCS